jgi:hypothetical protein
MHLQLVHEKGGLTPERESPSTGPPKDYFTLYCLSEQANGTTMSHFVPSDFMSIEHDGVASTVDSG